MCGILVFIGEIDEARFIDALNKQSHRGPDDWGYEKVDKVHFGHRRLSIIDLSSHAKQPMTSWNNEVIGVFNGEIYNYREIRDELEKSGYQFLTNSDTEVLINAYHYFGEAFLSRLIGMFAFGIYDRRSKILLMGRDRLGIKPLFYSKINSGFCFSSEIKSILALDKNHRTLNLMALSSYLSFRYPIFNGSFFQGIEQLSPGCFMRIGVNGSQITNKYWSLSKSVPKQIHDHGELFYVQKIKDLFHTAVKHRMISDVPVGAYLSGGVDSSAIVSEMAQLSTKPIKTFTIGFKETGYNEFEYARIVAAQYKTEHHEITLSAEDYIETMTDLIKYKDAPLGVPNEVPLYRMSQELKKYITVVLSGEGADEIFGGYGRIFRSADDYTKWQAWKSGRILAPELVSALNKKYGKAHFKDEADHFLHLYRYTNLNLKSILLNEHVNRLNIDSDLDNRFREIFAEVRDAPYTTKMMYVFELLHLPGLLQRLDTTTMAASVEGRVPFVDHQLVEFAFTIPLKYKLKWKIDSTLSENFLGDQISESFDIPKYILKKTFETHLSEKILYRKKMGFPVPLDHWFGGNFRKFAQFKILGGELVRQELINKKTVADLLRNDALGKNHAIAMKIWMLLNLEIFLEQYNLN